MSGTSIDAIDAVLVSITAGDDLVVEAAHSHPIPPNLRDAAHALCQPAEIAVGELDRALELDAAFAELFAQAAGAVIDLSGIARGQIRAIGSHGQTLRHHPAGPHPFSLQIGNPAVIAELTGITTVADFRARDIAAGGQGAPLVPALHNLLFRSAKRNRIIVNIGGVANVTYLAADRHAPVLGFDTGPGNTLMDQWILRTLGKAYDANGAWAATGTALPELLNALLNDSYFDLPPPKSTGRDYFNLKWLDQPLSTLEKQPHPQDVQATLVQLSGQSIARAALRFLPPADEVYVCGGGSRNATLMRALSTALDGIPVQTTEVLGLHPDWVEAAAFAWLAHQTLDEQPGNVPSVTGARRAVVLGGIYKA